MKKRDPFPYRPDRVRVSSEAEFEETVRLAREAHEKLPDSRATVVVLIARVLPGDTGISMQAALMGGCDATVERIAQAGPAYLADFIKREVTGRLPS